LVVLGLYAFLSLEPFDWQLPRQQPNHAERLPAGWRFPGPGIVIAEPPHSWLDAAQEAETVGVSLLVRPSSTVQSGPARILTMSRDTHLRNLIFTGSNLLVCANQINNLVLIACDRVTSKLDRLSQGFSPVSTGARQVHVTWSSHGRGRRSAPQGQLPG
jgi:hypothetical protein